MFKQLRYLAIVLALGTALSGRASANLIVNGGFDNGLDGWTQPVDPSEPYPPGITTDGSHIPSSATHAAELGTAGLWSLSQTVSTVVGKAYVLSFWLQTDLVGMSSDPSLDNFFSVSWNGAAQAVPSWVTPSSGDSFYHDFTRLSFDVIGTGSDTVSFDFRAPCGYYYLGLVDLSLQAPEMSSFALACGCTLLSVPWFLRRSRKTSI